MEKNMTINSSSSQISQGGISSLYAILIAWMTARSVYIQYGQSWINVIGVIGNVLIVLVFFFFLGQQTGQNLSESGQVGHKRGVHTSFPPVSRIYYTLFGICDLSACLFGFFLRNTVNIVPAWITGGKLVIDIADSNDFCCKMIMLLWLEPFTLNKFALMCLAFERMLAVCFPLRTKSVLGVRFTVCFLILIPGTLTTIGTLSDAMIYKITRTSLSPTPMCTQDQTTQYSVIYQNVLASIAAVGYVLMLLFTVIVGYKLLALRSTRAEMQAGQQAAKAASLARREASASITMMALVTIYVVVHGQSAIWWVCNTVWTRYWPTSPMVMILYALTVFTVELDSPLMCFNFFLYLARIRAFRQGLLALFTCRL